MSLFVCEDIKNDAFTTGSFNYYTNASVTPMEDEILQCPFDNPKCLETNLNNKALTSITCNVYNGRLDSDLCFDPSKNSYYILDSRGILITKHTSQVTNFWNEDDILNIHYPEMKQLAYEITGADRIAVAAHALRKQGDINGPRLSETISLARDAAFTVHNDFSDLLKEQFVDMFDQEKTTIISDSIENGGLGITSKEELMKGRLSVINFWRPLSINPLERNPLAVLDATSIRNDEIILCKHPWKDTNYTFLKYYKLPIPFINTLIRPNLNHKWYYFPSMTRNEVLIFKNYDSMDIMPKNGVGMHTSFNDPNTNMNAPPRESIEIRIICYWNPK